MAIIGFHYTKIMAEKKKSAIGNVKVSNGVSIVSIKEAKINAGDSKQKGAEVSFKFTTKYEPAIATIELEGAAVYVGSEEKVKETLSEWEKKKTLPSDVLQEAYNLFLNRCNVESLLIGREMQLPPNLPLPKIKSQK